MMEGDSGSGTSSRRRGAPGWPGVADAPDRTPDVVDFLGKALGSLDMYHFPDEGRIFTTIFRLAQTSLDGCKPV